MYLICKKCRCGFISKEDNYECSACGYDMRPYATGKRRVTKSGLKEFLFWLVYSGIVLILVRNMAIFKSELTFPFFVIVTVFVSYFKNLIKRRNVIYKEVIGERLDGSKYVDIDVVQDSLIKTYIVVYKFFVDDKEYRCVSGDFGRITYHLFAKKNAKIMYNVNDPRDSYEKSLSIYIRYLFDAFILIILYMIVCFFRMS